MAGDLNLVITGSGPIRVLISNRSRRFGVSPIRFSCSGFSRTSFPRGVCSWKGNSSFLNKLNFFSLGGGGGGAVAGRKLCDGLPIGFLY